MIMPKHAKLKLLQSFRNTSTPRILTKKRKNEEKELIKNKG